MEIKIIKRVIKITIMTKLKGVGKRGSRILDDLRNRRRYWELKNEDEDRKRWQLKFMTSTERRISSSLKQVHGSAKGCILLIIRIILFYLSTEYQYFHIILCLKFHFSTPFSLSIHSMLLIAFLFQLLLWISRSSLNSFSRQKAFQIIWGSFLHSFFLRDHTQDNSPDQETKIQNFKT